jgi:hypothetical protein
MNTEGYVKFPRYIVLEPLYMNQNAKALFLHLLLMANYKDDGDIKRGQCHTSLNKLAKETGLSKQNVRTALSTLSLAQKITRSLKHHSLLITICDYDNYQGMVIDNRHDEPHNEQHADSHKVEERKYTKKENKELFEEAAARPRALSPPLEKESVLVFAPPTEAEVASYVQEKQYHVDPHRFFTYYADRDWKTKIGSPISDWKKKIDEWNSKQYQYGNTSRTTGSYQGCANSKQAANEYALHSLLA